LQKRYFQKEHLDMGVRNLKNALSEGGVAILGSTESFAVYQRCEGEVILRVNGRFLIDRHLWCVEYEYF